MVTVGFSPSSSVVTFRFSIAVEKAVVGKARRSRRSKTERVMIRPREKKERRRQAVVSMS